MATIIKLFKRQDVGDVLQRLVDTEIGEEIAILFDPRSGCKLKVADSSDDSHKNELNPCRIDWHKIEEVISALAYDVFIAYPQSSFAKWYEGQLRLVHTNESCS